MTEAIYLDHHATTPIDPVVLEAMMPWLTTHFGNPGSVGHAFGEAAREAVETARADIAQHLGITSQEIVFTSGATESNNLALKGIADRHPDSHFVSITTEHKAILDPLARLATQGHQVTLLQPVQMPHDLAGLIDVEQLQAAIEAQANTVLASVMLVNNEIGAIQPIHDIAARCREANVLLHCDATQAIGKMPVDLDQLGADLWSFSGHKIYGPRGIGVLVVRRRRPRIRLEPQIEGGGQEQGRRSGTLNVPAIVGLAKAVELCQVNLSQETQRIAALRERLYQRIRSRVDGVTLNGPRGESGSPASDARVAGNLNLCFDGVDGEALMLNMGEVAVSSGSACTSANPEPSHVLRAIGLSEDQTSSSLRFGIGRFNTEAEIDLAAETVAEAVKRLRQFA